VTRWRSLPGRCVERGQYGGAEARGVAVRSMDNGTRRISEAGTAVVRGAAVLMGRERGNSEARLSDFRSVGALISEGLRRERGQPEDSECG